MGANGEAANRAALGLTSGSGAFGNMEDSSRSAGGGAPRNGYHSMEEQAVVDKALKTHQDTTASALRAAKVKVLGSQVGGCLRCLPQEFELVGCLNRWCASGASAAWPQSAALAATRQSFSCIGQRRIAQKLAVAQ